MDLAASGKVLYAPQVHRSCQGNLKIEFAESLIERVRLTRGASVQSVDEVIVGEWKDEPRRLLRYVDGDYNDPATFKAIKRELGSCERPARYLAIPPGAVPVHCGIARA